MFLCWGLATTYSLLPHSPAALIPSLVQTPPAEQESSPPPSVVQPPFQASTSP